MGRLAGYEYSYSFLADDSIIPFYSAVANTVSYEGMKTYLFDIRTSFKLKGYDGQITDLGWERFGSAVLEDDAVAGFFCLEKDTKHRLKVDYWMSDAEIRSWAESALDFAKQTELAAGPGSKRVIGVVVRLDVMTVQQEGEPINDAIGRAIKPESLIPLYLWTEVPKGIMSNNMEKEEKVFYGGDRALLLFALRRIRVEDEEGMALTCAVCSRSSAKGTQICFLPTCKHACHPRCLFEWLREWKSCCPSCCAPIPTDYEIDDWEQFATPPSSPAHH